jgi:YD repeat-containing protein
VSSTDKRVEESAAAPANPWPGLASYTENDRALFFGRERETAELLRLIERESLTVLFGRSGLGKTSLLRAGVIPELRQRLYFPLVLRLDYSGQGLDPTEQAKASIREAARAGDVEMEYLTEADQEMTLWEFLHTAEFWSLRNDRVTPVLIFDQFEEVFTIGRDVPSTSEFVEQLADLVENRIPRVVQNRIEQTGGPFTIDAEGRNYKIVLSLRDDFVSKLDSLRPLMPAVMRNRLALDPLDAHRALAVINAGGEWVDTDVARDIVDSVAGRTGPSEEPATASSSQAEIEPAYLSVMCHELFRRMIALGKTNITRDLVAQERGGILEGLYERSFEGLDNKVRPFVEDRLVTASGFRMALPLAEARAEGISARDLDVLVDRRLLRFEDRLGARHIELSHDLLTPVVQKSRDERQSREALELEAQQQKKLRKQLIRSRIRTVFATTLAAVFLAILVLGYFAYFHRFEIYTATLYKKRFGVVQPVGSLSASAVKRRYVSFKFTRQGFRPFNGQVLALEAIDSLGQCSPARHSISTALRGVDESQFSGEGECRWEFIYNAKGELAYEIARNRLSKMVWGFVYSPTNQSLVRKAMFVGPDGYPQPQGKRPAEYVEITYNREGYEIKHRFMDRDGKPASGPDGAFGRTFEYDEIGRRTKDTSTDLEGLPMNDSAGNASGLIEYDSDGNVASWTALDKDDQPTLMKSDQTVKIRYIYDDWGNRLEARAYDEHDMPATNTDWQGSLLKYKYDDQGNRIESRFFVKDDVPIDPKRGFHLIRRAFDRSNNLVSLAYFGPKDQSATTDAKWHEVKYLYDEKGFVRETSYFNEKGQAVSIGTGYHMIKRVNDEYGRALEMTYYNANLEPLPVCALISRTYDESGKLREERCSNLSKDGAAPAPLSEFRPSIIEYQYDRFGNQSEVRFFNLDHKAVNNLQGYHLKKSRSDESGHVISEGYFDGQLQPVALPEGFHVVERAYSNSLLIGERYLGRFGEEVAVGGVHCTLYTYNDKQQETKRQFFDNQGQPAVNKNGIHLQVQEYDRVGHRTGTKSLDRASIPSLTPFSLNSRGCQLPLGLSWPR